MISVIMAIYNEPIEWIRESINSILNQTYKDIEFIIVNDNPEREDNVNLLEYYSSEDKRIKVITNPCNIGLTKSLNIAVREAKGDYLARMDADDISLPYRLEKQIAFMQENPNCDYCSTDFFVFSDNGQECLRKAPKNNKKLAELILTSNPICHPSVMFKAESIQKDMLYDEDCLKSQDYELWLRLLIEGKKYRGLNEPLLKYRISGQQISTKQANTQAEFAFIAKVKALSLYFQNLDINISNNNYDTEEIFKSIKKKRNLNEVDKIILFCLCMTKRINLIDTVRLVARSIFKYRLEKKHTAILLLSIFTNRYQVYNISDVLNNIC